MDLEIKYLVLLSLLRTETNAVRKYIARQVKIFTVLKMSRFIIY